MIVVNAALWVWNFVVGDLIIGIGVTVALIAALLLARSGSTALVDTWGQVIVVAIILATLALSLARALPQQR